MRVVLLVLQLIIDRSTDVIQLIVDDHIHGTAKFSSPINGLGWIGGRPRGKGLGSIQLTSSLRVGSTQHEKISISLHLLALMDLLILTPFDVILAGVVVAQRVPELHRGVLLKPLGADILAAEILEVDTGDRIGGEKVLLQSVSLITFVLFESLLRCLLFVVFIALWLFRLWLLFFGGCETGFLGL